MHLQFITVQHGLCLKIDSGMELTGKFTAISVAKRNGWTFARTSRQALRDINYIARTMGLNERWSKKYGDESNEPVTIEIDN